VSLVYSSSISRLKRVILTIWREGLLVKKVLENNTKGYKVHPQLYRFKNYKDPIYAINGYLSEILEEAKRRNYYFDSNKIYVPKVREIITVTAGQINFEYRHFLKKLKKRNRKKI